MISKVSKENGVLNRILSAFTSKKVQMAIEFDCFKVYKSWGEGVDLFRTTFESNYKGDHTPLVNLFIGMFNFKILELGVYNVFHEDYEEDDENLDAPYKTEPFPYYGKKVCGNCCNYGYNAPEHGSTSQCVLNGSGVMPEGLSCGVTPHDYDRDEFEPFTPLDASERI